MLINMKTGDLLTFPQLLSYINYICLSFSWICCFLVMCQLHQVFYKSISKYFIRPKKPGILPSLLISVLGIREDIRREKHANGESYD